MSEKKKTGPKSRGGMGNKYRYAKNYKVPKGFPYDPKSLNIQKNLFNENGNGWWVKPRVECVNLPSYWFKAKNEVIERENYKR